MREGFLDEVAEVMEALDTGDVENLAEELGDVLFHLVFQAQMAAEVEDFRLTDVVAGVEAKLRRRHPHVWGDWEAEDARQVEVNWEAIKQAEKGKDETAVSALDNVPHTLPALARAQKIQPRAATVGFDWPTIEGVYAKLVEEIEEIKTAVTPDEIQAEVGDLLFSVVNLARWLGVDSESAVREATLKFNGRFRAVEKLVIERELIWESLELAELDALWNEVK